MTSNDAPAPGPAAGRRRALGRGPGTTRPERPEATAPPIAEPVEPAAPLDAAESEPVALLDAAEPEDEEPLAAAETEPVAPLEAAEPETETEPGPESETRPEVVASLMVVEPEPERVASPVAAEPEGTTPSDGVFKVRLSNFEGPFDLLLQLISKHKLDVTEVALSKVTDEFMAHIRAMGPD
ncbi:segregation/condensation protein A, partial [Streptomyces sp. NPDC059468]